MNVFQLSFQTLSLRLQVAPPERDPTKIFLQNAPAKCSPDIRYNLLLCKIVGTPKHLHVKKLPPNQPAKARHSHNKKGINFSHRTQCTNKISITSTSNGGTNTLYPALTSYMLLSWQKLTKITYNYLCFTQTSLTNFLAL